jgi:hypothetical protein
MTDSLERQAFILNLKQTQNANRINTEAKLFEQSN